MTISLQPNVIDAFDAHCHLDLPAFDGDREAAWERARALGVRGALIPAVHPEGWSRAIASHRPGERWIALGVHPYALPALSDEATRDALDRLAGALRAGRDAVVAVGECGLDATLDPSRASMARQRAVLEAQIEVARSLDLPLVLHLRRAHEEALETLGAQRLSSQAGMVHGFSGSAELARRYLALGLSLSFGGAITRATARRPLESLRATPPERLLIETDAPDQLPSGIERASRRCEPADLRAVLERAALHLGVDAASLASRTARNARALFGLAGG